MTIYLNTNKPKKMKKKILVALMLTILLLLGFAALAQSTYTSTYNQTGEYSKLFERWNWSKANYTDIEIRVYSSLVVLDNKAKSNYTLVKDEGEDSGTNSDGVVYKGRRWYVRDNKGRYCYLLLTNYYTEGYDMCMTIMYEDIAFRYYIPKKKVGSDSFFND